MAVEGGEEQVDGSTDVGTSTAAEPPGRSSTAGQPERTWRTTFVLVLAGLALVHTVLVAVWLAPSGPVRDAVGGSRLSGYVDPYFRQSWTSLDPSAQRGDEALWVRARVQQGGNRVTTTPWLDVTKVGLARTRGDVAPARVHLAGRRLATNLNHAMLGLGAAGRRVALQPSGHASDLRGALLASGAPAPDASTYLDLDTMTTRLASLYTQAYTDRQVVQVQYRVGRRTAPPHEDRGTAPRVDSVPFTWLDAGWRPVERGSEEARAAFKDLLAGA